MEQFKLSLIDSKSGTIKRTQPIKLTHEILVQLFSADDFNVAHQHELDNNQIKLLEPFLRSDVLPKDADKLLLSNWIWLDDLPYEIHTGREYYLMSRGLKPLAVFSVEPNYKDVQIDAFEDGVSQQRFVKLTNDMNHPLGVYDVLYALPQEAWRLKAYVLLEHIIKKTSYSKELIMMEGGLLGYTDEQNETFLVAREQFLQRRKNEKK